MNIIMNEGQDRVRSAYRDNYPRLAAIKAKYDPHNLFHINQNIVLSLSRKDFYTAAPEIRIEPKK